MAKNPDAKTGYKRPPADHEILLTMAIVDPGYMVNMPQGATGASGCDMLTYADISIFLTASNEVLFTAICRYNVQGKPTRMGRLSSTDKRRLLRDMRKSRSAAA